MIDLTQALIFGWLARLVYTFCQHRKLDEFLKNVLPIRRQCVLKLMVLGSFDIFITLPITTLNLITALFQHGGITTFWPRWKVTHANISAVTKVTSEEWKSAGWSTIVNIRFSQWISPLFAVVFFILFGITEKNRLWYRDIFRKVMKTFRSTSHQSVTTAAFADDSCSVPASGAKYVQPSSSREVSWTQTNAYVIVQVSYRKITP